MKARLSRRSTPVELASEFASFMRELEQAGVDEIQNPDFYFKPLNDGEPVYFIDEYRTRHDAVDVGRGPTVSPYRAS